VAIVVLTLRVGVDITMEVLMSKFIRILELSAGGASQREISQVLRCSLRTVSQTLKAARGRGVSVADVSGGSEADAKLLLFGRAERVSGRLMPDFAEVASQLKKDGVNLSLLWDEYARVCAAAGQRGYQYSQYAQLYARWRRQHGLSAATMRVKHVPGRLIEVDWAGGRADYVNRVTGEVVRAWVFVGCLPYSQRLFVEAFDDMKIGSWVKAHQDMLRFFGGVPELITPDNCKTGVAKPDYYDPQVNKDYQSLADHYGFAVLPARPVTPKDKASAENSVKFIQTWVIAYLRSQVFFSLAELNQAITTRVGQLNQAPFKGLDYSRDQVFTNEEAASLKPLPATSFELADWRTGKVGIDYCVQVDHQRYSVPYRLIGAQVDIRVTESVIEVFNDHERVCSHPRLKGKLNQASIIQTHMPPAHQLYLEAWNPERFVSWASSVGPACKQVIESILASKPHPAQTYRACLGVLGYAKTRGDTFLEDICRRAIELSAHPSYTQIKTLTRTAQTVNATSNSDEQELPGLGGTGMVRGASYYQIGDTK
jgi:transposase